METQHTNCDFILTTSYPDEELLDQQFLIPDSNVITYTSPEEYHNSQYYPEQDPRFVSHHQTWEHCTASLEEVESAVFSSSASSTSPSASLVEVPNIDTRSDILSPLSLGDQEVTSSDTCVKKKPSKRSKKKSAYKHIPHSEKPAHLVAKRNARERRRVEAVNAAFLKLRKAVPLDNKRGKRISKVKILQRAIDYILNMKDAIDQHDGVTTQFSYDDRDDDQLFAF